MSSDSCKHTLVTLQEEGKLGVLRVWCILAWLASGDVNASPSQGFWGTNPDCFLGRMLPVSHLNLKVENAIIWPWEMLSLYSSLSIWISEKTIKKTHASDFKTKGSLFWKTVWKYCNFFLYKNNSVLDLKTFLHTLRALNRIWLNIVASFFNCKGRKSEVRLKKKVVYEENKFKHNKNPIITWSLFDGFTYHENVNSRARADFLTWKRNML